MHRRARPVAVALLATVAAVPLACGGDGGGGGGGDFSVRSALDELPTLESDEALQISMADLDTASELAGLDRPAPDAGRDGYAEWLNQLTGGLGAETAPIFVSPPEIVMSADLQAYRSVVGVSFLDATSFATVAAPPEQFTVLTGVGDAELDEDLVEVTDGVVSDREGGDGEQELSGDLVVDRLGRPVRFAQDDERVASSLSTSLVESWLAGDADSLGDDESLAAIAGALDDADVVSAALFTYPDGTSIAPSLPADAAERLGVDELPASFTAIGLGWASDGGDAVITAVYRYADDETASSMVDVLEVVFRDGSSVVNRRPIAEYVELDSIEADGRLVVATMSLGPAGRAITPLQMVVQRDLPFASG